MTAGDVSPYRELLWPTLQAVGNWANQHAGIVGDFCEGVRSYQLRPVWYVFSWPLACPYLN
jgi:hypothetical protein